MEEPVPSTTMPPQTFLFHNRQATSILSSMMTIIVQATNGTFAFAQTPPPLVNQIVGEQTTAPHATSFTSTMPLSMPLQEIPLFTTNQLLSMNQPFMTTQPFTTTQPLTTGHPFAANLPLTFSFQHQSFYGPTPTHFSSMLVQLYLITQQFHPNHILQIPNQNCLSRSVTSSFVKDLLD